MLRRLLKPSNAGAWGGNNVTTNKIKVLDRPRSSTKGQSGLVSKNSFMELLVELPDGKRTYMSQAEVDKFNTQ